MLSFSKKKWCVAEVYRHKPFDLAKELNIPVIIAVLMINRGVTTTEEAKHFLNADLALLHDPFLMAGMGEAVKRIIRAIDDEESITVFCDYDVDGVTSAAFLTHFFRDLNCTVTAYLPERHIEGLSLIHIYETTRRYASS